MKTSEIKRNSKMTKFKVGDYAEVIMPPVFASMGCQYIVSILEVRTQLCEAGIEQVCYQCRLWMRVNGKISSLTTELVYREMELGEKIEKL